MSGIKTDKVLRRDQQAFSIQAPFGVVPPTIGRGDVDAGGIFIAGGPLKREIVGETMGACVEGKIALRIMPGRVVRHLD